MESKDWSGFGYFSPDLEKIEQLLVRSEHQYTCEDTGNVVKYFLASRAKRRIWKWKWKETESSTPFVVNMSVMTRVPKFIP